MTPWQLKQAILSFNERIEWQHNHDAWIMWHGAYLGRWAKELAPYKEFTTNAKPRKGINSAEIKAAMMAHNLNNQRKAKAKTA